MPKYFHSVKVIARNRKAFHDYEILDKFEAGIELYGTEVKAIRAGRIALTDSFALCQGGQIFLNRLHISPYELGNRFNHEPYRKRRLLLHQREIRYLCSQVEQKRLALIPLQVYFKKQWVKVELGLARGRKQYDKRQKIAAQESKRRLSRVMGEALRR
ncbi:MAG: SsrA-binding protein SmpB [Chitinivibrionales bacterium]|nr:SsrA-binding protein SmpB [Chitinivibrionales bacterium]